MRIRSDNEEIAAAEVQIKTTQDAIRKLDSSRGVKTDLPETGGADTAEKYEQLLRQEQVKHPFP
jgi:hypothetical protein